MSNFQDEPISATIQDGILTMPDGQAFDLRVIQAAINFGFQETADPEFLKAYDLMSKITGLEQGPSGEFVTALRRAGNKAPSVVASINPKSVAGQLKESLSSLMRYVERDIENNSPEWTTQDIPEYVQAQALMRQLSLSELEITLDRGRSAVVDLSGYKPGEWGVSDGLPSIVWWRYGIAAKGEPSFVQHVQKYASVEDRIAAYQAFCGNAPSANRDTNSFISVTPAQLELIRSAVENYRELVSSPTSADRAANGADWADREAKACDALLRSGLKPSQPPDPEFVTLDLNVLDDDGNIVDGTTANLSVAQISGIVDHASQLILNRREGHSLDNVLDELDEALSVADVISAPKHIESHRG